MKPTPQPNPFYICRRCAWQMQTIGSAWKRIGGWVVRVQCPNRRCRDHIFTHIVKPK